MTSRNLLEIEGSPLNLSLSGSQVNQNQSKSSYKPIKRPPIASNRSHISSSTSNLSMNGVKKPTVESKIVSSARPSSGRSISGTGYNPDRKTKPSIVSTYLNKKKTELEDDKPVNDSKETIKESLAFVPLSVRSSTDDLDSSEKLSQLNRTAKTNDDLEYFFSTKSKESESKEEKINKLKSSVDSLRRAYQIESQLSSQAIEKIDNRAESAKEKIQKENVESFKRRISAKRIQRWYRANKNQQLDKHQAEIEKLFSQKKAEMKKKMEQSLTSNSIQRKKSPKQYRKPEITQSRNLKLNLVESANFKEESKNEQYKKANIDNKPQSKESARPFSLKKENDMSEFMRTNAVDSVQSLLFNLDKIEKESSNLLQFDSNKFDSSSNVTNDKLNSILSYLDEATNESENQFTPKHMKEYNYDLHSFNDLIEPSTTNLKTNHNYTNNNNSPPLTPKKSIVTRRNSISENASKIVPKPNAKASSTVIKQQTKTQSNDQAKTNHKKVEKDSNESTQRNASDQIDELNETIMNNCMEIEEKKRTIAMLEKALNQQRELTIRHTQEADREMQIRLEAQKNDYEMTIQRHLGFIDQLIDDKKNLSEKCEKLVKELKEVERTYSDRLKTAEERYKVETQKIKDTFEAAERIRREKWIEEKTKKIKEMTVKGLEPEIQALITKHKNEIKALKASHEAELLQADERAAQKYIRITEELRENYEREKEACIQRERDVCKQRYEKSLEEEEKSFLEQRRRLYAEVEEEKNRIAEQASFQRRELDKLRKMLEENNLSTIESIKKEYNLTQNELEKKHQNEIKTLKEQLDIEKQSWEQNYMKKQENWMIQKERELKEQVKRERDKEIELLINRLESESSLAREEIDRAAENRIKRVRDKYESELREVEKTERETMERYNNIKAKFNEIEGEYERLKVVCKQKEKDLEGIKKLTDTLQDERNRLADVIRQDFSDRIIFTEEENKRLKLEMAELKSRNQIELDKKKEEIEKLQREQTEELNKVHEKIKQLIGKKDESLNQLKQQYEAACKRADHLEGLLEQQRTLMLKKQASNSNI